MVIPNPDFEKMLDEKLAKAIEKAVKDSNKISVRKLILGILSRVIAAGILAIATTSYSERGASHEATHQQNQAAGAAVHETDGQRSP